MLNNRKKSPLCLLYNRKFIQTVNSPIVFSHNDLQGGNILCRQLSQEDEEKGIREADTPEFERRLTVIDFEFCSYNFRAFDIANHWAEWMYDYGHDQSPYYTIKRDKYPSKTEQV
jgi:choline/ethanolamine kinase